MSNDKVNRRPTTGGKLDLFFREYWKEEKKLLQKHFTYSELGRIKTSWWNHVRHLSWENDPRNEHRDGLDWFDSYAKRRAENAADNARRRQEWEKEHPEAARLQAEGKFLEAHEFLAKERAEIRKQQNERDRNEV